jgi:N-acetylglutamate synthase
MAIDALWYTLACLVCTVKAYDAHKSRLLAPAMIALLESLSANAWPAAETIYFDGWRLRYTGGVTRRANSVWPNAHGGAQPLDAKLAAVEDFYARHGAPAIYQICDAMQPAGLDDILAARGYTAAAHSHVQTASIAGMLAALPPLRTYPAFDVAVAEDFDEVWFDLFCTSEQVDAHGAAMRRSILQRIEPAHAFAVLRAAGEPAAVGLGVAEQGWLGIFCMATLPALRRQGAARAILRTLALWSQLHGAGQSYLQVMQHNTAGMALYAPLGFTTAYDYHYRVRP